MTIGNIAAWKKNEKELIEPGDVIADIETDKATMEWEAVDEGYVAKILMPAGSQNVAVNDPVMVMVEDEADIDAFKDFTVDNLSSGASSATSTPEVEEESVHQAMPEPSPPPPPPKPDPIMGSGTAPKKSETTQSPSSSSSGRLVYYTKDDAMIMSRPDNWIPGRR